MGIWVIASMINVKRGSDNNGKADKGINHLVYALIRREMLNTHEGYSNRLKWIYR